MKKELVSEENFMKILEVIKSNEDESIELKKGKKIIELIKSNEKFDNFLTSQFIEDYIQYMYTNYNNIMKYDSNESSEKIHGTDLCIDMTEDEFKKEIQKIAIEGEHLSEDELQKAMESFQKVKSDKNFDNIISYRFIKEYVKYVYVNRYQIRKNLSKRINHIKKDKDGDYLINDLYIVRDNNDGGKNSPFWISIERNENDKVKGKITKDIVVKNMFDENKRETALVAEEIARQLKLPVAQYYPAKYIGSKYLTDGKRDFNDNRPFVSKRIVITPNFLEEGEELITGDRIAGYEMDIRNVPNLIREYLSKEGLTELDIDCLIRSYKILMAYNCLINHRDCHNGNWGFIKKADGRFKIAHIFDLEGSLTENVHHIRAIYVGDSMDDDKILYELLKDKGVRAKVKSFLDLNISKVFSNVHLSKGVKIPAKEKNDISNLIDQQKDIINNVINRLTQEEEKLNDVER